MSYRFPKSERIRLKRDIDALFAGGGSFFSFPFRCVYTVDRRVSSDAKEGDAPSPCGDAPLLRMLVSVGKRYSKSAVRRNLIKRRAKEAFRLNKGRFVTEGMSSVAAAFIYVSKKEESYDTIARSICRILAQICTEAKGGSDA